MARVLAAASVVFLVACGAEDDIALDLEVGAATVEHGPGQLDPEVAALAEEALLLVEELIQRLEEREVTLEELQAALDTNDAEAARELFGYSPEEYAAANIRVLDLAERVRAAGVPDYPPPDPPVDPEGGWDCDRAGRREAFGICALTAVERSARFPNLAIAALIAGAGGLGCYLVLCRWDDADPGPPVRPK